MRHSQRLRCSDFWSSRRICGKNAVAFTALLLSLLSVGTLFASAQVLEEDPLLKAHPPKQSTYPNQPSYGQPPINQQDASGIRASSNKMVLKGNVTTLDTAMIQEKDIVDWYGWYMACRQYLVQTGGIQCSIGTMIRFNRNGYMTALTAEPACILSVSQKVFPLPRNTKVDGILLPVRSARSAPASPDELYRYLKGGN